ncbi:MAG TPA: GNAT family N-acetyltransferase, partial [Solirubrobacteraceae bacterium]|nr:GNAT family N-acetyltransferase [Solirubrobacteraceae bacterium]
MSSPGDLEELVPAWTELYDASEIQDPFAHPAWLRTWAEHFVAPGELRAATVWEGERLVAFAPFYRDVSGIGPARLTRLRLLGAGQDPLTELAQIVILPAVRRRATRTILEFLHGKPDWDWIEVFVPLEEGWLDPDSVPPASGSFVATMYSQACVIVSLPGSPEDLRRQLKRNVTESIRRARNRLERDGHQWAVTELREPGEVDRGLDEVLRLHRARAAHIGRATRYDRLADPRDEAFVREAVGRMAGEQRASVHLLEIGGTAAGGLIVLRAPGSRFLSLSGYDPRWWDYGILNLLTSEVLGAAIRDGDRSVNLSSGPENSKLRWSEEIAVNTLFAVVAGRRRSRLAFELFLHARAAGTVREGSRVARAIQA